VTADSAVRDAIYSMIFGIPSLFLAAVMVRQARDRHWPRIGRLLLTRAGRAFRRGPVPADGTPLTHREMRDFTDILRGWDQRARDPARAGRGRP
jgi:hypothetical protein